MNGALVAQTVGHGISHYALDPRASGAFVVQVVVDGQTMLKRMVVAPK
jgi:hypothetical protein